MKIFAVTSFIVLLATAIFLTNLHLTVDQESSNFEETTNISAVADKTEVVLTNNNENNGTPAKQTHIQESLENKHGTPPEFSDLNTDNKTTEYSQELVTITAIEEPYIEKFQHLEATSALEAANLVELALNDYNSKKQNGENISYVYFYRTYYPKVKALQSEIEAAFEKKYSGLRAELEKHGFSPENAEKFKVEFEEKKKEQLKQMMVKLVEEF